MADADVRTVPVLWVGVDDLPVALANQFALQGLEDELIFSLGQLLPPFIVGSEDERRAQLDAISYVPIKTLCRVSLTKARLGELIDLLTRHRATMERLAPESDR